MYKNFIFDFGNVLARFYPDELTKPFVKDADAVKQIGEVVFDRVYWKQLDDGTMTDSEAKAEFCKRLPQNLHNQAFLVYDNWVNSLPPVEGMPQLVADIKNNGGKLYLVSNISKHFAENYHKNQWVNGLLSLFDGLVLSGPIGITKPDKEIFNLLLERYNLNPQECIFVDDTHENIKGAALLGIDGYLFDGDAEKLRKILNIPSSEI